MDIIKLTATDYKKLRRRKRREQNNQRKLYLVCLFNNSNSYPSPVVTKDKERNYVWVSKSFPKWSDDENSIAYYKHSYRGNHKENRYQFYKKYANRVVRKYKGEIPSGCGYKKCFDYWWTVD